MQIPSFFQKFRSHSHQGLRPKPLDTVSIESIGSCSEPGVPMLQERHLRNCVVVPNRSELIARMPKNSICAEVGVLRGDFSVEIAELTQPTNFHLVDSNAVFLDLAKSRLKPLIAPNQLSVHKGNSYDVLAEFADGYFDWIYLDADHTYEFVSKDLKVAHRKLKRDGFIVLNDYAYFDHIQNYRMGVIDAANEFCINEDFELVYFAFQTHGYNDVAIRKIQST